MRIGVIGAGQLGRMLALAGYPLGLRFVFLDTSAGRSGAQVAPHRHRRVRRPRALAQLPPKSTSSPTSRERAGRGARDRCDGTRAFLAAGRALACRRTGSHEKTLFRSLEIPTPPFVRVDSEADAMRPPSAIGTPGVLKTRRLGYDGRGQRRASPGRSPRPGARSAACR